MTLQVKNCLLVSDRLCNQTNETFDTICKGVDLTRLSRNISVGSETALSIDFFDNILVTKFQGVEHSLKLSNALGIIGDLSEIFAKILSNSGQKLLSEEEGFSNALALKELTDVEVKIDDKVVIGIYPNIQRVVLTTSRGQSSIPLKTLQSCAHLFNRAFAQEICPMLGLEPTLTGLTNGIYNLYLGRCILGLKKSMDLQNAGEISHQRELARIVSLIVKPGSAYYTSPFI